MKKVLVIAYNFPPIGSGGASRTASICSHIMKYGWQPVVLTDTPGNLPYFDDYLLEEVNESEIIIERTGKGIFKGDNRNIKIKSDRLSSISKYISDLIYIPDSKITWLNKALKKGDELWKKYGGFDLIFAGSPPYTDLLIGQELKKKYKKPLVCDYTEGWVGNHRINHYPTLYHKISNINKEKYVIRDSNKIITTNRRIKELIIGRYNNINYNDIILIPNFFIQQDIDSAKRKNLPYTTKMRITYTGTEYSRGLNLLFKSVRELIKSAPTMRKEIEFLYLGMVTKRLLKKARDYGVLDSFYMPGYVNYIEFLKYSLASDVFFLHYKRFRNDDANLPGVIGHYIGSEKNFLAVIPEGVTKNILYEYGASKTITDYNPATIAEAIYDYYKLFEQRKMPLPNQNVIDRFRGEPYIESLSREFNFLIDLE